MHSIKKRTAGVALALSLCTVAHVQAAGTVTFAGWGGALQDAERKAYLKPAEAALGIKIQEDNMDGLAAVRAQVMSGKPKWDVVELASNDCVLAQEQGLTEPLDYSVISTEGVAANFYGKNWIASNAYSTVLAWANDAGNNTPKTWKAFFDPEVKRPAPCTASLTQRWNWRLSPTACRPKPFTHLISTALSKCWSASNHRWSIGGAAARIPRNCCVVERWTPWPSGLRVLMS